MKYTVFVDGQEGTTGLKIHEFLSKNPNVEVLKIEPELRKDQDARRSLIHEADLVFLCLPDSASREAVSMAGDKMTKIIDASTAFRIDPEWTYGLPELNKRQRGKIENAARVSVPGCHATGYISAIRPLVAEGIVPKEYPATCYSITGYSGGGKKRIADYQHSKEEHLHAPRHYALTLDHKHLPEMQLHSGLNHAPVFTPIIGNYYQGMAVSIPLLPRLFHKKITAGEVQELLASYYKDEKFIRVMPYESEATFEDGFFNLTECNHTNQLDLFVFGKKDEILLVSRLDNLGKGAAGAAIQNMNLMLGLEEGLGL